MAAKKDARTLPVAFLRPGKYQPRKQFDEQPLADLAASVKEKGVLSPILVRPLGPESYEIVAGERRWRAAQIAKLHDVPVVIREMADGEALEIATLGGAKVLNRDDIGALAPGMAADFVAFDLNHIAYAGALHDPLAALVFCAPTHVSTSVINGKVVVRDGHLVTVDLPRVLERHNQLARQLVSGE